MNLTVEKIRTITCGAVSVAEESDGIHFYRFTPEQMELYRHYDESIYDKTKSTAGVRLSFRTNSESLHLKAHLTPQSGSRRYYCFDVFVNGKKVAALRNYNPEELPDDYTETPLPVGEINETVSLGTGQKEVCIYLPWNMHVTLKALGLDDGETVEPVKYSKKIVCFGDSITQGYDALCPYNRYTARLADALQAEEFNKAIGGEFFWPTLAKTKESFTPDYITVAYGTNDWSKIPYAQFLKNCIEFYAALASTYPKSQIFAITPIWRRDHQRVTDFPSFDAVEKTIAEAIKSYKNITMIYGFDLVNHDEKFFADSYLHPNDAGFAKYAENLEKAIKMSKSIEK